MAENDQQGPNQGRSFIALPTQEALPNETVERVGSIFHAESRDYYNYVLVPAVSQSQLYAPPSGREQLVVTELGCETANVLNAVTSFFSGVSLGQFGDRVYYTGIDTDAHGIAAANLRARRVYAPILQNLNFQVGDATRLSSNPHVPAQSDIVIVRHPYSRIGTSGAAPILRAGYDNLTPAGIMVVTTYDQTEIDDVNSLFGGQVRLTGQTHAPGSSYTDRHVSVIVK